MLSAGITSMQSWGHKFDQLNQKTEHFMNEKDMPKQRAFVEVHQYTSTSITNLEDVVRAEVLRAIAHLPRGFDPPSADLEKLTSLVAYKLLQDNTSPSWKSTEWIDRLDNRLADSEVGQDKVSLTTEPGLTQISRHTSCKDFACIFGTLRIRKYIHQSTELGSYRGNKFSPKTKEKEVRFHLAPWLRRVLRRGAIVSRINHLPLGVAFNLSIPRIIDSRDGGSFQGIWSAVQSGNINSLQDAFSRRIASPTDLSILGQSLLSVSKSPSRHHTLAKLKP